MRSKVITLLIGLLCSFSVVASTPSEGPQVTTSQAIQMLKEGNQRFVAGNMSYPHQDAERLEEIKAAQHPFAAVLSCSDSRVPIELVFDAGFGDLFGIRVAGNVCGPDELASIEYSVEHLGTPVLLVLGHSKCGAVTAAATGAALEGALPSLIDRIMPAVECAQKKQPKVEGKQLVPAATKENVWQAMADVLTRSEVVRRAVEAGKLKVIGGVYDLNDYTVGWLGAHPNQASLLEAPLAVFETASAVQESAQPATAAGATAPASVPTPASQTAAGTAQPEQNDPLSLAVNQLEAGVKSLNQESATLPKASGQPTSDRPTLASIKKEIDQLKVQIAELKAGNRAVSANDPVLASVLSDIEALKAENKNLRNANDQNSQKLASLDDNVTIASTDNGSTMKLAGLVKDLNTALEKSKSANTPQQNVPTVKRGTINLMGFVHQQYYNKAGGPGVSSFESKRARIGVNGTINQYSKVEIVADFAKSPKLVDGFLTVQPVKALALKVGQYRPPSGNELAKSSLALPFVNYALAMPLNTDRDLGASLHYDQSLSKNVGLNLACGFYNGSGINTSDSNTTKNMASRVELKLANQLTLSSNGYVGKTNNAVNPGNIGTWGTAALWNWKNETVEAEYTHTRVSGVQKSGWYVYGLHSFKTKSKLLPEFQLGARYEQYDPNLVVSNNRVSRITLGTNLLVDKRFTEIQLNYQINGEQTTHVSNNEFLMNFQVSF